jgi:hypothetical protein
VFIVGNGVMQPIASQLKQLDYSNENGILCGPCRGYIKRTPAEMQLDVTAVQLSELM